MKFIKYANDYPIKQIHYIDEAEARKALNEEEMQKITTYVQKPKWGVSSDGVVFHKHADCMYTSSEQIQNPLMRELYEYDQANQRLLFPVGRDRMYTKNGISVTLSSSKTRVEINTNHNYRMKWRNLKSVKTICEKVEFADKNAIEKAERERLKAVGIRQTRQAVSSLFPAEQNWKMHVAQPDIFWVQQNYVRVKFERREDQWRLAEVDNCGRREGAFKVAEAACLKLGAV